MTRGTDIIRGIVVNPKYHKPCLVTSDADGAQITIYRMEADAPYEGGGYYESYDGSDYAVPARMTGLPRSHTPDGVKSTGEGYGTCLYTALCLCAYQASEDTAPIRASEEGPGICSSTEGRSSPADHWWDVAHGHRITNRGQFEEELEDFDISNQVSSDELEPCIGITNDDGQLLTVRQINSMNVDATFEMEIDTYLYSKAEEKGLVVCNMVYDISASGMKAGPALNALWPVIVDDSGDQIDSVDVDALKGLDVRGLHKGAINLLMVLARYAGASEEEVDAMHVRWRLNLDPSSTTKQLRLIPNARSGRAVKASLQEAKDMRRKLGWDKLRSLP